MTTTRLDDWAAHGEALLQRPAPPEAAWGLAAALFAGLGGQRPASVSHIDLSLQCGAEQRTLRAPPPGLEVLSFDDGRVRWLQGGVLRQARAVREDHTLQIALEGGVFRFTETSPWPASESGADPRRARAPVAGVVAQVSVAVARPCKPASRWSASRP